MVTVGVSEAARSHFQHRGSDILYELRILTQPERATAAEFILDKKLDADGAHEVAKAIKELSRLRNLPEGFSNHPGDAAAYQCWKGARQKTDMQERSRLIARGLTYAHSQGARKQIEQLLTDFTVTSARRTPRLPVYRVESVDELPRILPVVGRMPLTVSDLQAVPPIKPIEPFQIVQASGNQAWVPVPGWQVVCQAEDPVAILCQSDQLPTPFPSQMEEVLVVVERSPQEWDENSFFLVEQSGQLQLQWFEDKPDIPLLGRVLLVMRPHKIFDEEFNKDPWQIEE